MRLRARSTSARSRTLALAAAVPLVLSGCGTAGGDPSSATEDEVAAVGTEGGSPESAASDSDVTDEVVTPRPGMVDVQPVANWYEYGSWDGELMYVTFPSQGAPCEVLDRIEIEQTADRAMVTLFQGRDPDIGPDEACDGPSRALRVLLPPLERDYGAEEGSFVNGANPPGSP